MFQKLFVKFASLTLIILTLAFWSLFVGVHHYFKEYEPALIALAAGVQLVVAAFCGLLIRRLHKGNFYDHLTRIGNRSYFYEKLGQEIKRSKRTGSSVALVFIDIDKFKMVNDTYGHIRGDKVLVQLAGILKENVRGVDSAVRWGGEEFAIILPETSADGGVCFAERLRERIEAFDFGFKLTISVGVAATVGNIDIDKFVSMADDALYRAKDKRNAVVDYATLAADGIMSLS